MGTCTSTARHQQKQQQHNRIASKNPIVLDIKPPPPPPLPPLPLTAFPNHQLQHHHSLFTDFDILSSLVTKPIFHQSDTNSLIHLYSSNSNNNNNNNNNNSNIISWMSSSSSVQHVPPRIPVPKTRLPLYQQAPTQTVTIRPKLESPSDIPNNQTGFTRPMSATNRAPPPTTMQTRFGFIPRPTASGLHQTQGSSSAARSRSISPTSTVSAHSSSSSLMSQRAGKNQTVSKTTPNRSAAAAAAASSSTTNNTSKPKILTSPHHKDSSIAKSNVRSTLQTPTTASQNRSRTPLRTFPASPSSSVASPLPPSSALPSHTTTTTTTDVTTIRDRYKTQKRMNFFTRRTPISTANGSPIASSLKSPETIVNNKDNKKQPSPTIAKPLTTNNQNNGLKPTAPPQTSSSSPGDSAYANVTSPSNQPRSAHLSQGNRHRQRAISMLSSASGISDVLNQDALFEDDNCSLKSEDLMCDYEDTLTMDSASKTERTDSCSSASFTVETNKKPTTIIPVTPTKPNVPVHQSATKVHRSATIAKCSTSTNEKINGSLRESLDELNRLSNRMDNGIDNEHNRRLRSLSLKPPSSYLPPLEDAEQITMDIECYRQVMKDVTVVKTILHQLDRLLKHSDGATMTESMIGSFHEFHDSILGSRRFSSSGVDGNLRNSIDENSSYDDLLKEIITLRKEKEQDKQTIKLLQEQMYKYSSQTNN